MIFQNYILFRQLIALSVFGGLDVSREDERECQPDESDYSLDSDALSEYNFVPSLEDDSDVLSDAFVCDKWDEPNYISADNCYYPDIRHWQASPDP
jgi:hypothetical protein